MRLAIGIVVVLANAMPAAAQTVTVPVETVRAVEPYTPLRRGLVIPAAWIAPQHYVADYARLGLYPPPAGTGWSRYFGDAVLSDRYGRVLDVVTDMDWSGNRPPVFASEPPRRDRNGKVIGAVAGAAAGAVAGNLIGGKGDRLAGSLIGGGVGAAAGAAIGAASDRRGQRARGERRPEIGDVIESAPLDPLDGADAIAAPGWGGSHWAGPVDHVVYHNGYGDTVTTITFTPQTGGPAVTNVTTRELRRAAGADFRAP